MPKNLRKAKATETLTITLWVPGYESMGGENAHTEKAKRI